MAGHVSAGIGAEAPAVRLAPRDGVAAGFTGREFGNASLLLGGGDPAAARRALGPLVGAPDGAVVLMEQVHGAEVARVSRDDAGRGVDRQADAVPGVDALVTTDPGLALAVLTADCVPVLLAGDGVVGAAHAGRAGLLAGVVERTVEEMARCGAPAASLTAVIGPAIGGCCYEVPTELARQAVARIPELAARTRWGSASLDLPRGVAAVLRGAGVGRVGLIEACTRCAPHRWFSHRAATDGRAPAGAEGRQAAVIALGGGQPVAAANGDAPGLRLSPQWLS